MAETTADVRRDIELTRERMTSTLQELEQRLNVVQVVKDHPWPALAVAFGAGLVLAGTGADRRAAEATSEATRTFSRSAGGRVGPALDGLVADLIAGVRGAFEDRVDSLISEVRHSVLGSSSGNASRTPSGQPPRRAAADLGTREADQDGGRTAREAAMPIPSDGKNVGGVNAPRAD